MLTYLNNSDTAIIIVHEVYGLNEHIKTIAQKLAEYPWDIFCPNLLDTKEPFPYQEEQLAYNNFLETVGFVKAFSQVRDLAYEVRSKYKYLFILGYSVGATTAWLCSQEENLCDGIIGYYGSRIRDYFTIDPQCPTLLFFPSKEKSFNIDQLLETLQQKNGVMVHQLSGEHGFSDPYSKNFSLDCFQQSFGEMIKFIQYLLKEKRSC